MIRQNIAEILGEKDVAESMLQRLDEGISAKSRVSPFHILTAASIIASIFLFARGKKLEAIFVGLWPATFQALKSATRGRSR
jgi:hypothetical protein